MSYTPTEWEDEVPSVSPVKFTIKNSSGTIIYDDITIEVKTPVTAGTQMNAANFNNMEDGIEANDAAIALIQAAMASMLPDAFTAKGQIPRASGAGAMALLALGAAGKSLKVNAAGNDIEWGDAIKAYYAEGSTYQSLSTSYQDVTDASVNVSVDNTTQRVIILAFGLRGHDAANWALKGFIGSNEDADPITYNGLTTGGSFAYAYSVVPGAAGSYTVKLQAKLGSGSGSIGYTRLIALVL